MFQRRPGTSHSMRAASGNGRLLSPTTPVSGNTATKSRATVVTINGVHRRTLITFSDYTYPDGESGNEQADGDERQNVVDEIGHWNNSSLFTYVYFLFHFCSKVNTRSCRCMYLRFTKNKHAIAGSMATGVEQTRYEGEVLSTYQGASALRIAP